MFFFRVLGTVLKLKQNDPISLAHVQPSVQHDPDERRVDSFTPPARIVFFVELPKKSLQNLGRTHR